MNGNPVRHIPVRRQVGWWASMACLAVIAGGTRLAGADDLGDPLASPCRALALSYLQPSMVVLGETVTVRDRLAFSCPERRRPFHLSLVAWRPEPDEAGAGAWAADEVKRLAADLRLGVNAWSAVGVVAYGQRAAVLCPIERDAKRLDGCVDELAAAPAVGGGAAGLADGVYQGLKTLVLARSDARLRQVEEPLRESMVVIMPPAAAVSEAACVAARAEVEHARVAGVDVSLACPTGDCAASCLPPAVPLDRFYPATAWDALVERLVGQARASQLRVASVTLTEHLAPGAGYVVGSADPPVTAGDGQQGFLTWRFSLLERQEQDLSYAVAPTVPGNALVARLGYLVFTDTHGRSGNTTLPPRGVLVAGERIWTTTLPLAFCCQPSIDP